MELREMIKQQIPDVMMMFKTDEQLDACILAVNNILERTYDFMIDDLEVQDQPVKKAVILDIMIPSLASMFQQKMAKFYKEVIDDYKEAVGNTIH